VKGFKTSGKEITKLLKTQSMPQIYTLFLRKKAGDEMLTRLKELYADI
jgi:hypothetical protein